MHRVADTKPMDTVTPYELPTWFEAPRTALEIRDALAALNSVSVTVEQIEAAAEAYAAASGEHFDPHNLAAFDAVAARRSGMQAMVDYAAGQGFADSALAADALDYRYAIIYDCYANGFRNPRKQVPSIYFGAASVPLDPGAFRIWPEDPRWRELRLMGLCEAQIAALGTSYNGDGVPAGYMHSEAARAKG